MIYHKELNMTKLSKFKSKKTQVIAFEDKILEKQIRSPLRYPGGKSRAARQIFRFIPKETKAICSPFLGGGSLELYCISHGIKVYGYDNFRPLIDFWQCLLDNQNKLADKVEKYHPLKRNQFYHIQKEQIESKNKFERATLFFVLNRTSYSGSTLSGGMATGGKDGNPRFTISSIQRLRDFKIDRKKISIKHLDILLYLDPPYLIESKLYGVKGDLHRNFDHDKLCQILKNREKWILSYNDSEKIREMYSGYQFVIPKWTYGMSKDKKSREILILSNDISIKNSI